MPESKTSTIPEVIPKTKRLPKKKTKTKLVLHQRSTFSGPLPHPSHFAQYESILKGAAERILKMTENQSAHRQECEKIEVKANSRNSTLGLVLGFLLCSGIAGGCIYVITIGKTIEGITGLVAQMAVLASAFIWGRNTSKEK